MLLASIALVVFLEIIDAYAIAVLVPSIAESLNSTYISIKGIITGYLVGSVSIIPIIPWLSGVFGIKKLLLSGLFVFACTSIFCALAPSPQVLLIARIVQGIGAGLMGISARAMLVRAVPSESLARTMGYVAFPAMIAPALGSLVAGVFADSIGWRWFFFINPPIALILFVIISQTAENYESFAQKKIDPVGSSLLVAILLVGALLFNEVGERTLGVQIMSLFSIIGLSFLYWRHSKRAKDRLAIPLHFFYNSNFKNVFIGSVFLRLGVGGIPLFLVLVLQNFYGIPAIEVGILMAIFATGMAIARPFSGTIFDRLGHKKIIIRTTFLMIVAVPFLGVSLSINQFSLIGGILFIMGMILSVAYNSIQSSSYEILHQSDPIDIAALMAVTQQFPVAASIVFVTIMVSILTPFGAHVLSVSSAISMSAILSLSLIFFRKLELT